MELDFYSSWSYLYKCCFNDNYSSVDNYRKFTSKFGVVPQVAEQIFLKYASVHLPSRLRLMIVLHYLKVYPTEDIGSSLLGFCRETYRKLVRDSINYLSLQMNEVLLESRFNEYVPGEGIFALS